MDSTNRSGQSIYYIWDEKRVIHWSICCFSVSAEESATWHVGQLQLDVDNKKLMAPGSNQSQTCEIYLTTLHNVTHNVGIVHFYGVTEINSLGPSDAYMRQQSIQHWFRWCLFASSAPSHYLNQCWNIVNWTIGNKLLWNLNWNLYIITEENPFENFIWKMAAILCRPQCVNSLRPSDAVWRQWSWTTLAQVMACCLTAPSHYLNQCWLIRGSVAYFWEQFRRNCSRYRFRIWVWKRHFEKIFSNPPGANELKGCLCSVLITEFSNVLTTSTSLLNLLCGQPCVTSH